GTSASARASPGSSRRSSSRTPSAGGNPSGRSSTRRCAAWRSRPVRRSSSATVPTSTCSGPSGPASTPRGSIPKARRYRRRSRRRATRSATSRISVGSSTCDVHHRVGDAHLKSGGRGPMGTTRKVIIIGSGPAGYTAAIYAARANLAPLMLTGVQPGGQLMLTTLVENYPGFVDGLMGPDLMEMFKRQAERFGTEMIAEDATAVDFSRRPFVVRAGEAAWEGHTVIIATGATAKLLGLPAEGKLMGR